MNQPRFGSFVSTTVSAPSRLRRTSAGPLGRVLAATAMSSAFLVLGSCATTSADGGAVDAVALPASDGYVAAEASFAPAATTPRPSASWTAAMQDPEYPTGIQYKTRIPDINRPREEPRVAISVAYEKYELGEVEFFGPGGYSAGKVKNEERERIGLRLRYGEPHAGVSLDVYQEDFLSELDLYGARLGFDGRNRWIELFGNMALIADYGIGLSYQGGNDTMTSDPTGGKVGVYYAGLDLNAGLGLEWRLLRVIGGYRAEAIRGLYGDDLGFGDLFDSEKHDSLQAFNGGAYVKARVDLDPTVPLFVEGQAVFGDMEGVWLNAGFVW